MTPSTSTLDLTRDLTRDLDGAFRLGTAPEVIDQLLVQALDALGTLVPYELATIMELDGDELRVRVARGHLDGPDVRRHRLRLDEFPSLRAVMEAGYARAFDEHDHDEGDGDPFDGILDLPHGHCCMVVPLKVGPGALGVMTVDSSVCGGYPDSVVKLADAFGKLLALSLSYGEQSALLSRLKEQLEEQNRVLRERLEGESDAGRAIESSRSPSMIQLARLAKQVAPTDTPVLITGATGTGKEVLANALHGWSQRADRPLVSINCAALPAGLIESELFGHLKGAFSGATSSRIGRFQAANGGTLFLDEVGEIPIDLQAKLLRVLQEGCFEAVGSDRTVRVDVRIIAATNVDLLAAVKDRRFREDLYYRLAVFPLHLPVLRERTQDIPVIAQNFLDAHAQRTGRGPWNLDDATIRRLQELPWPGNVRELVNALERATILSPGPTLDLRWAIGDGAHGARTAVAPPPASGLDTLENLEREHIRRTLEHTNGKLYGTGGAAEILGINANTLRSRMRKLGLGGARDFRAAP